MIQIPDWVFEFHGHKCPAMPIGYRAGLAAMKQLGVERASNKELFMVCENGPAHATACFLDGVMAATGCTYGKKKGLASEFVKLRSQGIEPKDIQPEIINPMIDNILKASDEDLFLIGEVHDSDIKGPKGTFNWHECEVCNEIVFENTTRLVNGKKVCIPCFEKH